MSDDAGAPYGQAETHEAVGQPHALKVDDILKSLAADRRGLSADEAAERLRRHGPNRLPKAKKRSPIFRFLSHFHNVLIYVLLGSAVITAGLGHAIDTAVILAVVLANAIIADAALCSDLVVDMRNFDFMGTMLLPCFAPLISREAPTRWLASEAAMEYLRMMQVPEALIENPTGANKNRMD